MRKLTLAALLLVAVLALAACGGGGSSSSGGTTGGPTAAASEPAESAASPEAAWAKEITDVMSEFENKVSARITEQIHTSTSQQHLEPLYATYSINLSVLGNKLEATKAPKACVATREQMVGDTRKVAALTKELGHQPKLSPEQYAAKAYELGLKFDKLGHHLGGLTAEPTC